MAKELLVNVSRGEEVRVALVEEGRLEEIYLERDNAASSVGNIYLGKVTNVEGSIQAAFVDFGYGRNGFLHVQDLHPDHFPKGGKWEGMDERVGKKIGRRDRPPIQDCLRRGDRIVVQIIKEGIGTKGPTLTSYPSIPGRFLVAMPGVGQMGVSKNIEDETERRRLRKILDGLEQPEDVGFIIRTAGEGKTKLELERDFKYLSRLWAEIAAKRKNAKAPALLYSEGDLVTRTVRDVWSSDVDRIVCDDVETALRIRQFFKLMMPRTKVEVALYEGRVPLFHAAGVEREIETMFSRHVPLANGGSLVIDTTEAVVAIDVNSGKFREHGDAEETAFRMDLEAADEICRQLRLRDLGGLVICDFIDLRYSRHRQALFDRLTEQFKRDRAKSRHLMMSEFGIVEMTRQRMRPDLKKSVFMPCPWSRGSGYVKTPESLALDVVRRLHVAAADDRVARVVVRLYPTAAIHVQNAKRRTLAELEHRENLPIEIRPDESLAADAMEIDCFDTREQAVTVDGIRDHEEEGTDQGGVRRRRRGGRGRSKKRDADANGVEEAIELDEGGLVDLDGLTSIGDLKLEEVEAMVDQAKAEKEAGSGDAMTRVLEALHRAEKEAPDAFDEPAKAKLAAKDEDEDREAKGGRRRGRRRRGGRSEDETPTAESPAPIADEVDADDAETPSAEAESPSGGRRRRGRRRRGRRDEAAADVASNGAVVESAESSDDEDEEAATPEAASDELDREIDHEAGREVEGEREGGGRRRRRRGRRRRGGDHRAEQPGEDVIESSLSSSDADEEAEDEAFGEPIALGEPADSEPADEDVEADEAAESAELGESGGRRRRRRRRRRGRGSAVADAAPTSDEDQDAPEPTAATLDDTDDAPESAAELSDEDEDEPAAAVAEAADDDADDASEPASAETESSGGRRRRRRRRRRGGGAGGGAGGGGAAEADASPSSAADEPDEAEEAEVAAFDDEAEASSDEAESAALPARRTRRRRAADATDSGEPVEPMAADPSADDDLADDDDDEVAGDEEVDEAASDEPTLSVAAEPEAGSEAESPARRRRRRRAGKKVISRPMAVEVATPAEPAAEAAPPAADVEPDADAASDAEPEDAASDAEPDAAPPKKRARRKRAKKAAPAAASSDEASSPEPAAPKRAKRTRKKAAKKTAKQAAPADDGE